MSKYTLYSRNQPAKPRPWKVHPIWRGIGCLMLLIVPVMSYAGSAILVEKNKDTGWIYVPPELMRRIRLPYLGSIEHLFANLIAAFVIMFIAFGALMILYTIIYKITGPSFLTPLDAPPVHYPRRKKR